MAKCKGVTGSAVKALKHFESKSNYLSTNGSSFAKSSCSPTNTSRVPTCQFTVKQALQQKQSHGQTFGFKLFLTFLYVHYHLVYILILQELTGLSAGGQKYSEMYRFQCYISNIFGHYHQTFIPGVDYSTPLQTYPTTPTLKPLAVPLLYSDQYKC